MRVFYISILLLLLSAHSPAQQLSPEEYIDTYKDVAISYMEEHGCPASIILAVAMHESANGNSKIAQHLNNHFGIKGKNNETSFRSAYKGYASIADSYTDFVDYLKRRKQTKGLFETHKHTDYKGWARGIAAAGYAQSTQWASQVIRTIERHKLYELDGGALIADTSNPIIPGTESTGEALIHRVNKGDTLYDLARKYGTTVKKLKAQNALKGSRLQIGQQLIIIEKNTST